MLDGVRTVATKATFRFLKELPCTNRFNKATNVALCLLPLMINNVDEHVCHSLNEAGDVDVHECGHQELAVEPVHQTAVTRNGVAKILQSHVPIYS